MATPSTARKLVTFSAADTAAIDRTRVRWDSRALRDTLRAIWHAKGGALRMPYTVYTHRMLLRLRVGFDREGYQLRAETELTRGTVAVRIVQKRTGNRPSRIGG
jgi:hypothetical protein